MCQAERRINTGRVQVVKLMDENGDRVFDEEGRALYNFKHRHLSLGKYDIVKELGTHSQASTRTWAWAWACTWACAHREHLEHGLVAPKRPQHPLVMAGGGGHRGQLAEGGRGGRHHGARLSHAE